MQNFSVFAFYLSLKKNGLYHILSRNSLNAYVPIVAF